jgi:hypothetical protein
VDAAIRHVTGKRANTQDPLIKKNADKTLAELKKNPSCPLLISSITGILSPKVDPSSRSRAVAASLCRMLGFGVL